MTSSVDPVSPAELSSRPIFELTYKRGHLKEDLLFQAKDLSAAVELGNAYCKAARFRFITVSPFIHDLQKMLDRLNGVEATTLVEIP